MSLTYAEHLSSSSTVTTFVCGMCMVLSTNEHKSTFQWNGSNALDLKLNVSYTSTVMLQTQIKTRINIRERERKKLFSCEPFISFMFRLLFQLIICDTQSSREKAQKHRIRCFICDNID